MKKISKVIVMLLLLGTLLAPGISGTLNILSYEKANILIDPEAPEPPTIIGPSEGELNVVYTFEIISEDPQCDNICYTVISSDMPCIYKSHFCVSGQVLTYNHSFDDYYQRAPPYYVKAKATDCKGYESDWSVLEVTIPKAKFLNGPLMHRLFSGLQILEYLI